MVNQSSIVVSSCCALKTNVRSTWLTLSLRAALLTGVVHSGAALKRELKRDSKWNPNYCAAGFLHFFLLGLPPNSGHTPYYVASIPDAFAEVRSQERITMVDRVHEHHFISPIVTDHRDCPV